MHPPIEDQPFKMGLSCRQDRFRYKVQRYYLNLLNIQDLCQLASILRFLLVIDCIFVWK